MEIRKRIKKYNRGISKAISPRETLHIILKKISNLEPQILDTYYEIQSNTKIPQYLVKGTDYYLQIVNDIGRVNFAFNANGKGHFKTEAQVSGLMEMAERYSCLKYLLRDPNKRIKSSFLKNRKHYRLDEFYSNPLSPEKVNVLSDREVESANLFWYKAYSLDGQLSYLPLSLICYTYEYTNGMASGNTLEEALCHGICEVVERHCKAVVRENKLTTPTVNQSSIQSPIILGLLNKFKARNQKVILKDYSLGLGIPVVGAIRRTHKNQFIVTVGVAPNPEEATIRALIENSQVEANAGPDVLNERAWRKSAIAHSLKDTKKVDFQDLPDIHSLDIRKEILSLRSLLERQNMRIFYVDATDPILRIPSVLVYITNAKRHSRQIGYRNVIMGIIEESFKIRDYKQALKYAKLGMKFDRKNLDFYLFYQALVYAFEKKYAEAVKILRRLSPNKLYELQALLDIYIGICYLGLGKLNKTLEHLIKNIKQFPTMKFVFVRTHHCFDARLFKSVGKIYSQLHCRLVTTEELCSPCGFVFA